MSKLTIDSSRFGSLEIPTAEVIEFPNGLIGLGGRRYALVAGSEDGAFRWLHSLDDASMALPVANPWAFFGDYAVELSDSDSAARTTDPSEIDVWVTVRAGAALSDFYANLKAPIVVAEGRGHQVINEAADFSVRAPLFPAVAAAA